jgi:hypothetical protein
MLKGILLFFLVSMCLTCIPQAWAEPFCQILDAANSKVAIRMSAGEASANAALAEFRGALLVTPSDLTKSQVVLTFDPSTLVVVDAEHFSLLLRSLLQGEAGAPIRFVSSRLVRLEEHHYRVTGVAQQGSTRVPVSVRFALVASSAKATRLRGTIERSAAAGTGDLGLLSYRADFDLVFIAQAASACGLDTVSAK